MTKAKAKAGKAKGTKTKRASKGGRPSSYRPEFMQTAYDLCLLGATDAILAEHFGVAASTLYEWKKEYPEFAEAIKRAKVPADATIAGALFDRAKGAVWVEEQAIKLKEVIYQDGKRVKETERVEVVPVTRRAPPDTPAAIFWLKNRQPAHWRDKQEHEHSGTVELTREQREARVREIVRKGAVRAREKKA